MDKNEVEQSRKHQLKKLLDVSTPDEKRAIQRGRRAGQRLRRELEELAGED